MNDEDAVPNAAEAEPQGVAEPDAASEQEPETPAEPHPAHALIDEIQANIKVQMKPAWIHEKLERIRALL